MEAGRPPIYSSAEDMQAKVDEYFLQGDVKPTISGLAYFLGFESRQSFYDYEEREGFSYTVKRARARIEIKYEEKLSETACTGAIFALKNLGWKDKTEVAATVEVNDKPSWFDDGETKAT